MIFYIPIKLIVERSPEEIDTLVEEVDVAEGLKVDHCLCHCSETHFNS